MIFKGLFNIPLRSRNRTRLKITFFGLREEPKTQNDYVKAHNFNL